MQMRLQTGLWEKGEGKVKSRIKRDIASCGVEEEQTEERRGEEFTSKTNNHVKRHLGVWCLPTEGSSSDASGHAAGMRHTDVQLDKRCWVGPPCTITVSHRRHAAFQLTGKWLGVSH